MDWTDFSPPDVPTLDQQRVSLQKGLGRAMQWAASGRLNRDVLFHACLTDLRYDRQCEDSRADWLWELLGRAELRKELRAELLQALESFADPNLTGQLCELAYHYALAGDVAFKDRLYEIVAAKTSIDDLGLGEAEIMELDGAPAFLFAAQSRALQLHSREWDWSDDWLIERGVERFGAEQVEALLGGADPATASFYRRWQEQQVKQEKKRGPKGPKMPRLSTAELLASAKQGETWSHDGSIRWSKHAAVGDYHELVSGLLEEADPEAMLRLLRFLRFRPPPHFDARFITLTEHSDERLQNFCWSILGKYCHPTVRELALKKMLTGGWRRFTLLVNNYVTGDEILILSALSLESPLDELHAELGDVRDLLQTNPDPDADASKLALIGYWATPCALCREDFAKILRDRDVAPEWLREECRFDSDESTRKIFAANG